MAGELKWIYLKVNQSKDGKGKCGIWLATPWRITDADLQFLDFSINLEEKKK